PTPPQRGSTQRSPFPPAPPPPAKGVHSPGSTRKVGVYQNQKTRSQTADHAKTSARCTYVAAIAWPMCHGPRRQGFAIFILPARVAPLATPRRGQPFCGKRYLVRTTSA